VGTGKVNDHTKIRKVEDYILVVRKLQQFRDTETRVLHENRSYNEKRII
jgi:hypothetical protein